MTYDIWNDTLWLYILFDLVTSCLMLLLWLVVEGVISPPDEGSHSPPLPGVCLLSLLRQRFLVRRSTPASLLAQLCLITTLCWGFLVRAYLPLGGSAVLLVSTINESVEEIVIVLWEWRLRTGAGKRFNLKQLFLQLGKRKEYWDIFQEHDPVSHLNLNVSMESLQITNLTLHMLAADNVDIFVREIRLSWFIAAIFLYFYLWERGYILYWMLI